MSVEIRRNEHNQLECDWGVFDNAEADPRFPLQHLLLTTRDYVKKLIDQGPQEGPRGGIHSVTIDGKRTFAHIDNGHEHATWELFEAHWRDGGGLDDIMVGRRPD